MKTKKKPLILMLFLCLFISGSLSLSGQIPVVDVSAIDQLIKFAKEILTYFRWEIDGYQKIIETKDQYITQLREIIYRSEELFKAIRYFPNTVPGQYDKDPFFHDQLGKDIWQDLYRKGGRIGEKYPEWADFSYITQNPLYWLKRTFRAYADELLKVLKEQNIEAENELELTRIMKEYQQEREHLLDEFKNLIITSYASPSELNKGDKVVEVSKLYYAICRLKIEVVKQKLELLLMDKENLENLLKQEVNQVKNQALYNKFHPEASHAAH